MTYIRRKREAACFVPEAFERPVATDHCPCTSGDFECDYGYERAKLSFEPNAAGEGASSSCEPMPATPTHANPLDGAGAAPPCANGASTYRITRGYRRVSGDSCYGGAEWDAFFAPCPSWLSGSHIGKLVLVLLILIVVSLLVVLIGSKAEPGTPIARFFAKIRLSLGAAAQRYTRVGGGLDAPHSMADDGAEAFYLSEDEFGPSPHLLEGGGGREPDARGRGAPPAAAAAGGSIRPLPPPTKGKPAGSVPHLQAPPTSI